MNPSHEFARVREAMLALLALPEDERARAQAQIERDDPALAAEVVSLMSHARAPLPLLTAGAPAARLGFGDPPDDDVPEQVGPYLLRERLGAGGMGVVHRAVQHQPIAREVAVKLVRRGLDSRRVVARFDQERRVLARLEHPNIARVLDAGADPRGRPYFVMELVRGEPITAWCQRRRTPLGARLGMFLAVCDAVAHAHRRGIIHRDLKPSNVLVSEQDGQPTPKVIDFGIAKAIGDPFDDDGATMLTLEGQLLGTPDYMSPEQAGAFGGAVDTRTDVHALGVLLYELLTGTLPVRVRSQDLPALRQVLVDTAPERPSVRCPTMDAGALGGDLDVIVMHALEKDPERRYASVDDLAGDLRRMLAGLPILARPPTLGYRLGKLVARHRLAFGVGLLALAALAVFVATLVSQAAALAEESERARREASSAEAVADFLSDVFVGADPGHARGATLTARELVDRGADRLAQAADTDARIRARLLHLLGRVYYNLGVFDRADALLAEALTLRTTTLGPLHADTLDTLALTSPVAHDLGDDQRAIDRAREGLALRTLVAGPDDVTVAESKKDLAVALESIGREAEAEPLYRDAVRLYRRHLGDDAPEVAWAVNKLGQAVLARGAPLEARALFEHALAIQRATLGALHPDVGSTLNNLAGALADAGDLEGALATSRATLALFERLHGASHPDVGRSHANVASVLRRLGDPVEALDHLTIDLALTQRLLGPEHIHVGRALGGLGLVYAALGDHATAELYLGEALALRRARLGDGHRIVAQNRLALARLFASDGRWDEAVAAVEHAYTSLVATLGPEHPAVAEAGAARRAILDARAERDEPRP